MMYCDNLYNETIQLTQLQYSSCHCASKFQSNTCNFDAQCMMNTVFSHYQYSTLTCSHCLLLKPTLCFAIHVCVICAGRDVAGRGGMGGGHGCLHNAHTFAAEDDYRCSSLFAQRIRLWCYFVASSCILCPSDFFDCMTLYVLQGLSMLFSIPVWCTCTLYRYIHFMNTVYQDVPINEWAHMCILLFC